MESVCVNQAYSTPGMAIPGGLVNFFTSSGAINENLGFRALSLIKGRVSHCRMLENLHSCGLQTFIRTKSDSSERSEYTMINLKTGNTYLAIQRTLLAWFRTELALLGAAFAITRFDLISDQAANWNNYYLAALLCIIATLFAVVSSIQSYVFTRRLIHGKDEKANQRDLIRYLGISTVGTCVVCSYFILKS